MWSVQTVLCISSRVLHTLSILYTLVCSRVWMLECHPYCCLSGEHLSKHPPPATLPPIQHLIHHVTTAVRYCHAPRSYNSAFLRIWFPSRPAPPQTQHIGHSGFPSPFLPTDPSLCCSICFQALWVSCPTHPPLLAHLVYPTQRHSSEGLGHVLDSLLHGCQSDN